MSDNPLVAVAVIPPAPAGDTLPVPTPEQQQTADMLFSRPEDQQQHHVAAELLGMVASVQFLHDMANETFRRSEQALRDEELEELPVPPDENQE
jgi:hypothetical protein